ncbi:MAG: alpha/beta hydrolase [Thermoleophilaceae bacterium]
MASLASKLSRPGVLTSLMIRGRRAPLNRTPADAGMDYEAVSFHATDGVGLRGWFIAREGDPASGPAVAFVHGWLWNRLGNEAGHVPFVDRDVDLVPPARALHDAGFHVLMFDLRNHGESESKPPITYGVREAHDFCGAVAYLRSRPDVDGERIGALGNSMGANAVIYGTPRCQPVKAVLAVQPARLRNFNANFARLELGRLGPTLLKPVDPLYRLMRAPMPKHHDPAIPARDLGETVVQYVQGTGDPWGTMEDVEAFAAATPNTLGVVRYPSAGRYEGYRYVSEAVDDVVEFFRRCL